ncbi:MAG: fibrobacter succinogenes major paralogous domain-containing protein, partial [Bacteroidota bacterium]
MMKFWMILVGIAFTTPVAVAQTDSITDIEGNVYKTVQIGTQWWMAENLKVTQYTNGDAIPHLTGATEWANTTGGAYCYYENKTGFADTYGNLYNWHTVADARGVCPQGWHIPSDEEWITLEMHLGMSRSEADRISTWRGTDQGDQLKSGSFGGNNSSGFSVLGTGYRDPEGVYKAMGTDSDYWTSTPYDNQGFT